MGAVEIRKATREDAALILEFINELAVYEHMEDDVVATPEAIAEWVFDREGAEVLFALDGGVEVGFALFYRTFSTFLGRIGMHLEDLYVRPQSRGRGIGKALLTGLARICVERGYGRLEWQCLDWNEPSIEFYRAMGAEQLDEWVDFRVAGAALERLATLR